jgi:hypothetical protein
MTGEQAAVPGYILSGVRRFTETFRIADVQSGFELGTSLMQGRYVAAVESHSIF